MNKLLRFLFIIFTLVESTRPLYAESILPVTAQHGMVVTEQHLASDVGLSILKSGGNAVDAAVAVGYALAVVNPCCGNIGGGGFMTIHLAHGKNIFINFREKAPLAANRKMFLDDQENLIPDLSNTGYLAVATPGTVLGLETALKKYGTMTRKQVMAPAIKLAEDGFILTAGDIKLFQENIKALSYDPNVENIFLNKNRKPFKSGDRLIQKDLANTLKLISQNGPDAFYKGEIAKKVVEASTAHGGILSMKDFSDYTVQELSPVTCTYRGYTIFSAPPPSSGGVTLCEILNIIEHYPVTKLGFHSAQSVHEIVEAMRYAFYDRNMRLGDPDFVNNPVEQLTSKEYAKKVQENILDTKATPSDELNENANEHEGVNTTHYSIIDKYGNAVSVTYTLNSLFGAKVIADHTGFLLNNEMDDFSVKPNDKNQFGLVQGENNAIQPGKRPLSSMSPTILLKNNKVVMVVGSPGGPFIITSTLLTILNTINYKMNIQAAVDAPRFHHQWLPDTIFVEPQAFSKATVLKLIEMGYHITERNHWGAVEAIYIDPTTKIIYGGTDRRRPAGKVAGY